MNNNGHTHCILENLIKRELKANVVTADQLKDILENLIKRELKAYILIRTLIPFG